ncbi:MAG: hypothetical protein LH478_15875 [Chitinophagaceae bacterium]|nr:hypothetical protein [Chitinophagaceae bacterium]
MKIVLSLLIFCSSFSLALDAQQHHFVFIQTESRQAFNITLNKKVYSSTASGYVIVPKMLTGKYSMSIGFGGSTTSDQYFNIEIAQKDLGYTLKNVDEKGWVLFNLQSLEMLYAVNAQQVNSGIIGNTSTNSGKQVVNSSEPRTFQPEVNVPSSNNNRSVDTITAIQPQSSVATAVAEATIEKIDTVLKQTPVVQNREVTSKENAESTTDKKIKQEEPVQQSEKLEVLSNKKAPAAKSKITKISELKGGEAIYITYVDELANQNDTINVLIPDNKIQPSKEYKSNDQKELKFLEIGSQKSKDPVLVPTQPKVEESVTPVNKGTSNATFSRCITRASNEDFLKLRKKMAAAPDSDGMVTEAKKSFKVMCYTTEQIKNLAYLFLTDQARYQFFDASYTYVSDSSNFVSLSIMLADAYYINRFKAMLID